MRPTVVVLTGLPGSGKSTEARKIPGLRLNLDDIRVMMGWQGQSSWSKQKEAVAIEAMLSALEAAVEDGQDVIIDNTHLTSRLPGLYRRRVAGRADFQVISLRDVPIETCIAQDATRDSPVGEEAIRKMAKNARFTPTEEYLNNWPKVEPLKPSFDLPECIIVDLDGTSALWKGVRDVYDTAKCGLDKVDEAVAEILVDYASCWENRKGLWDGGHVFFLSGRDEEFRTETEEWLKRNCLVWDSMKWALHMRPHDTKHLPDYVVKSQLFEDHIRDKYNVLFALDDRNQIVDLWRRTYGIRTLQADYGNF